MELCFRYAALTLLMSFTMVASQIQPQQPQQQAAANVAENNGLRVGFYDKTCPNAEKIVQQTIKAEVDRRPGIAAGFIRLFFHDCFVRGCDGSVLLNTTLHPDVEMTSGGNLGLRGFTAIDAAKAKIELECPNTVSCADIVTFAARDAAVLATLPYYPVPSGRRDGTISSAAEVNGNLPAPFSRDVNAMTSIFHKKGLTTLDLVTLLGSHSMGRLHCKLITDQLTGNLTNSDGLGMDSRYVEHLKKRCAPGNGVEAVVSLNPSPVPLNRILTSLYYRNVVKGKVALMSDQALMSDPVTKEMVLEMTRKDSEEWKREFAAAMVKLGNVEVLTGTKGEIRKFCGLVNK